MNNWSSYLLLLILTSFTACKSSQPARPQEEYEALFEDKLSLVNIPVHIELKELEEVLNRQFNGVIYEDNDFKDGDNMMVKAEKKEDISLGIDSSLIKYRIPLTITLKYNTGLGVADAFGEIAVSLKTGFMIKEDWSLETKTTVDSYEWLEKPKLKMGLINLPVGFVADLLVDGFKETIATSIDEQVASNFDLQAIVGEAWKQMYDPLLVSPEYQAWLRIQPEKIAMTPLDFSNDQVSGTIIVTSRAKISLGQKPNADTPAPLPSFSYASETGQDFQILVGAEITYKDAEEIVRGLVVGETFEYGKRSITVEDIELYGQGNKLVVNTRLSGSYNGNIYMTGKPEYNPGKNTIDVKDLNYTVESKNFLVKSAAWLLRSKFKNMVQDNLDFLLDYNLGDMKQQIQQQLQNYPLAENIYLNGNLSSINIANAYLATESIRVAVALEGDLKVELKKLTKLGEN